MSSYSLGPPGCQDPFIGPLVLISSETSQSHVNLLGLGKEGIRILFFCSYSGPHFSSAHSGGTQGIVSHVPNEFSWLFSRY